MKGLAIVITCLVLSMITPAQDNNASKGTTTLSKDEFELSAKLDGKDDADYQLKAKVTVGVPFIVVASNKSGGVKLLSGLLQPEKEGEYPIVLTVFYGTSQSKNMGWAADTKLKLDQPFSLGFCGGLCWSYTVKLTRVEAK